MPSYLGTALVTALSRIGFEATISGVGTTLDAPGKPLRQDVVWYRLRGEAICKDATATPLALATVIDRVINSSGGWICGFNPNWDVAMNRASANRCVLGFTFTVIWPKFL